MSPRSPRPKHPKALKDLARRIRTIRKAKNLSINQAAKAYGADRRQWSALESGRENPSYLTLQKIAKVLKVPLRDLV